MCVAFLMLSVNSKAEKEAGRNNLGQKNNKKKDTEVRLT